MLHSPPKSPILGDFDPIARLDHKAQNLQHISLKSDCEYLCKKQVKPPLVGDLGGQCNGESYRHNHLKSLILETLIVYQYFAHPHIGFAEVHDLGSASRLSYGIGSLGNLAG